MLNRKRKIRRRIVFGMCLIVLCLFTFTGCQKSGNSDQGENTAGDNRESEFPTSQSSQSSQSEDKSLPDYACSGTYYKLEMTPTVYDVDAILEYLMPGTDRSRARQDERGYYSIEIDNITHTWYLSAADSEHNNFFYYGEDFDFSRMPTEQEARACSDDFIKHFGYQVAENSEFVEREDGPCSVYYRLEYEGVRILGKDSYSINKEPVHGEYIDITMGGNGILSLSLSNLYDVTAVLEEYPAEELISSSQLDDIINLAMNALFQDLDPKHEYSYQVKEIELIYIPVQEKEKWVLLPAFRVSCVQLTDGEVDLMDIDGEAVEVPWIKIIDAVSGYVYR